MKELTVYLNGQIVHYNEILPFEKTQFEPKLRFTIPPDKYYSIIMIDPDAVFHKNNKDESYLHLLIMNNTEVIVDFHPPTPPVDSGLHRYYIHLLKQPNKIKIDSIPNRPNFNLKLFMKKYNLEPEASNMFKTERK